MPRYFGPCLIVDRPTKSTIVVKTGKHPNGFDRLETHHWQNCRPAHVGPNTKLATRPPLGRPRQVAPEAQSQLSIPGFLNTTPSNQSDDLTANIQNNNNPPPPFSQSAGKFESSSPSTPDPMPNTSSNAEIEPEIVDVPSRPVRSNRNIPHPKYQDYVWSASTAEIACLNASINRSYA